MTCPLFFVVARVVGSDGSLTKWKERLVGLCEVSTTEPLGHTYYWGHDLDGEPDTLWGLEGYTHAVGFFLGHTSTDVFKHEMSLVDKDNLLKTAQGIGSPDYDLHHYDLAGGWLTREDDAGKDSKDSAVAVIHFWASEKDRSKILDHLIRFSRSQKQNPYTKASLQSCGVLKEIRDLGLATLWLRAGSQESLKFQLDTTQYKTFLTTLQPLIIRTETHLSQAFNGHIDKKPSKTGV